MIKQYVISPAYTDNSKVTIYENGVKGSYTIMSDWEVDGYCRRLEEEGYTKAYDLDELMEKLISAKQAYELAQKIYDEAVPYRLIKKE